MKFLVAVVLVLAACMGTNAVIQKIIYGVDGSDRISGIHQLDNGWILGGIGISDRAKPGSEAAMVISKDNGKTWKEIWVKGITDMKTYMIQSNGKVVIAVRGDRGNPQVIRSTDYGDTWQIALSASRIRSLSGSKGPLYSVIYHKYNKKFYVFPQGAVIESSDNGATWKKSPLRLAGCARNAYYVDETSEMYMPTRDAERGLHVLRKGANSITKLIGGSDFGSFAYVGKGAMVASAYNFIQGYDYKITRIGRKNNHLMLQLSGNHKLTTGRIVTVSVNPKSQFSNYENTNAKVQTATKSLITIRQYGRDVEMQNAAAGSLAYTGLGTNTIYRSGDYGKTWNVAYRFTGCNKQGYIEFARVFPVLKNGVVYISIAGHEEEINREGIGEILKSVDYGKTWKKSDEIRGKNQHRLNAIYVCTKLKDGRLACGAQYERLIFTLE